MFKLFLIIAFMANVFVIVSSTDTCIICEENEEYSECVNSGCDPRNCSQLGNSVPCFDISEEDCIGGCICVDGYLRDDNGTCIKKEQCPKCGNDPNAMPGCGVFCRQCSNYQSKSPLKCPEFCKINGCECKPGFIYDRNTKRCVKPQQCTPTCKANEVFSNCTNGECDARNCSQLGFPVPCIKMDPKYCIKGCVCQPDYLRAANGTCIPKTECPSCGGDDNARSGCGVFCRQCKGEIPCPRICIPNSCDCKPDFVYDPNINKCVKQSDCTPTCKDNEVYSDCTNRGCDAKNCSQLGFPVPCIKIDAKYCKKGCVCQQDYLRAANGTCIPKTECPSCGGDENAQSGCGVFCRQCKENVPCPKICKLNACDCKPDYVYDPNINKCVLRDQCTPTCQTNEEYSSCANGVCRLQNCSQYGQPIPCCPKFDTTKCKPGCICMNKFLRNTKGQCIPQEQCPDLCPNQNEVYDSCPLACPPRKCGVNPAAVSCIADQPCQPAGCRCKDETYRNDDGVCVTWEECPPVTEPPIDNGTTTEDLCPNQNEVYDPCPLACPPRKCGVNPAAVSCIADQPCQPAGCRCKDETYRNDDGVCVTWEECREAESSCTKPPSCKKNEVWESCPDCNPQTCSTIGQKMTCPDKPCVGACRCINGFVRDNNGDCVPKEYCYKCPKDEVYSKCPEAICAPKKCSDAGYPLNCTTIKDGDPCPGAPCCICKENYLRDDNGKCIPSTDCPSCRGDRNATSGCENHCGNTCADYDKKNVTCTKSCMVNGCPCRKGYVYDTNTKQCVLPCDCTPSCKKNEVWESCPDCNPQTCSTIGQKMTCPDKPCVGACRCINGFVRDNNGDCVPKEYCSRCTKPNEVYDPCPDCSPQTCETRNKVYNCPLIPSDPCDPRCQPACRCKKGFFRNKIGECISAENCAKCSKPHEYWSCGPACDNRCDSQYGQDNCDKTNVKCNEGCYCEKGFARDSNEMCIPKDDCPYKCPENEVYSKCPEAICAPKKCSDAGYPLNCTTINDGDPCPGAPCCICKENYLREDNGKCIPSTDCPSCRGDRNATSGCENHCGNTCADYDKKNVVCTKSCMVNGCPCRKGYVYDTNTKQCVLPCDCTKPCEANEEYSTCANGVCRAQSCSEYGHPPRSCPPFDKKKCKSGCVCKDKCLKNKKGKCVPQDQCPEAETEATPCDK